MLFDCAIIGGGPVGLNAALVLGRARRNVILFDNNHPGMLLHVSLMDLLHDIE
jgi:thioredoxin reductase